LRVVHDLGLVPELDRFAQPAFGDRAGIRVVQAHPPSGAVRGDPGQALPGLSGDLPGRGQEIGQIVDCPRQSPTTSARSWIGLAIVSQFGGNGSGPSQAAFGVGQ
jgi:hypothetical protein